MGADPGSFEAACTGINVIGAQGALWGHEAASSPTVVAQAHASDVSRTLTLEQTRSRGLVPDSVPATLGATLGAKKGRCSIKTFGILYRNYQLGDLCVLLHRPERRMFTESHGYAPDLETDGTNPHLQEQLLGTQEFQQALRQSTQIIRDTVLQDRHIRVGVGSAYGRHRSVAFAEVLAARVARWTEVDVLHMELTRWRQEDAPQQLVAWPIPQNQYRLEVAL